MQRRNGSWNGNATGGGVAAAVGTAAAVGAALWWRNRAGLDLRSRIALVSGGSRGLGLELARELLRKGAYVSICARDEEELERARAELVPDGGEVLPVVCDVGDREQVEAWVQRAARHFGGVDLVINNAGLMLVAPLRTLELEDFEEAMRVHFWGPLYTTWAALPHLRKRPGARLVNVVSIGGRIPVPRMLPYTASKFALAGLSEGLRAELAREGIRVTTVVPGPMRTGSPPHARFKGDREREYAWFKAMANVPLASVGARRAARRIVSAARRGQAHLVLTPGAMLAELVHGALPGLVDDAGALADEHLLPRVDPSGREALPGAALERPREHS